MSDRLCAAHVTAATLAQGRAEFRLDRRGGGQGAASGVVDELGRNVPVGAVHGQAGALGRPVHLDADPRVAPEAQTGAVARACHYFAAFPALREHSFVGVAHALALVGLGLAELADVGGDLAHLFLVDALDDDPRRDGHLEGDAFGGVDDDGVGEAERELERVRAPRRGAIAHADDLELLGEAVVTPETMLATSERDKPCRARCRRSSSGRLTKRVSPSWAMVIPSGSWRSSSPAGPSR